MTRAGDMVLPPAGRDPVKTQQEWFQELAEHALRHGQSALAAGSLGEALGWLERAHRIGPGDAGLALALATARLRAGQFDAAAKALAALAQRHDRREIWLSLAAARRGQGDDMGAAEALARAFSGHVLPGQATVRRLADAVAEAAGYPGWCGLGDDHQPVLNGPRAGCELRVDGRVHPIWRPVRQGAVRLDVLFDGWAALGSPIDMVALRRVEGVVAVQAGGLEGWAWHPGDPDRDPVLDLRRPDGRLLQQVSAFDTDLPAGGPLARPRRIRVLPDALRHVSGPIHVLGPDGRDLMGSPLEPGAEEAAAAWASRSVSRRFPAVRTREARHPTTPPAPFLPVAATQIGTPAQARPAPDRPVAVVVPVHGNPELTSACLASVFAAMPGGTTVIVVDDASPQAGLMASLDQLQRYGRIQLLRHATNRGFPASANAGMRAAAALAHRPDIVLLNSDTLVADGWLDGLRAAVHAAPDIGTATPFSNDATILSYPDRHAPNPAPDARSLRALARLAARANPGAAVDIPTAVGFCMYIRRECMAEAGLFREDCFAQGYGEENDFCLRARHLGWRHVAVPGVYVAHLGGQSFGAARGDLITRNLAVLERLHPGYHALIAAFQAADPLAVARRRLDLARWRADRRGAAREAQGSVILVTHDSGGGVERVVRQRCAEIAARGLRPILLRPVKAREGRNPYLPGLCRLDAAPAEADGAPGFPNLHFAIPGDLAALARILRAERPVLLEVHHLLGHEHAILRLGELLGIPRETHVHDYALFCPRISLVGRDGRYCGEPADPLTCEACVADLGRNVAEDIPITTLRARSAADLAASRRVVVPAADVASRIRRHFPASAPEVVALEDDMSLPPMDAMPATNRRHVGVIGGIGTEKGYDVLLACGRDAAARGLKLHFTVIGHTADDRRLLDTGRIFVTGPYREEEAESLIRAQLLHLAWLPSIWPETWCFTLGHAWRAGLGVAAFDLGAPAQRIRATGRGWLLPLGLPPSAINNALLAVKAVARDE